MQEFDNTQAFSEGWAVFNTSGTDYDDEGDWRIERLDMRDWLIGIRPDGPVFDSDPEAWLHVLSRAMAGSIYHLSAVRFVFELNASEERQVTEWFPGVTRLVKEKLSQTEWSGSPCPNDSDNFWIDDLTGKRIPA